MEAAVITLTMLAAANLALTWWVHYGRNPRYRAAQVEICVDRCLAAWEIEKLREGRTK